MDFRSDLQREGIKRGNIRKYQRIIFKKNAENQMRNEYTDSVTRRNQSKNTVTVPEYKEKKKVEKKTQRRKMEEQTIGKHSIEAGIR